MLTISIPDEIDQQLSAIADDKKEFIIAAIRQKILFRKKSLSEEQLAKEYADSIEENDMISKDFVHADKENWNDY